MRSTILLTSAMAVGAIAGPLHKRYIVTSVDLEIKTVTVYVTATAPAATTTHISESKFHDHSSVHSKSKTIVVSAPPYEVVPVPTSTYTPPPPPSSSPEPVVAPAPTSVYTPEPVTTTQTPVPEPVTTTQAPISEPVTTTQAAAPPVVSNNQHISGQIQDTFSSGPDYEASVLYHHNAARANHGAEPLVWDEECRANAMLNAQRCDFKHFIPEDAGQGQNLFTVSGDSFNVTAGITESWYKGEFDIMTDNNLWGSTDIPESVFHSVGHLTQILWKETTKVGCVSFDCGSSMTVGGNPSEMNKYTVCNYAGPGNVKGAYADNVGVPISFTSLGSWSD